MQAIGSLFGLTVKLPNPPIFLQYLYFKDGPTKTVNYIKETLNIVNLSFTSILSDGTLKDLTASEKILLKTQFEEKVKLEIGNV